MGWKFEVVTSFNQLLTDFLQISLLRNVVKFYYVHQIPLVFDIRLEFLVYPSLHLLKMHLLYTFLGLSSSNLDRVLKFSLEYIVEHIEVR